MRINVDVVVSRGDGTFYNKGKVYTLISSRQTIKRIKRERIATKWYVSF